MKKLQCDICGGSLIMDNDNEYAVCESCGMKFKQEAIKKMMIEFSSPIKVEGIHNLEDEIAQAELLLKLNDYPLAKKSYMNIANQYPSDYHGWWGLTQLLVESEWVDHIYQHLKLGIEITIPTICSRAILLAPEDKKNEISLYVDEKMELYKKIALSKNEERLKIIDKHNEAQQNRKNRLDKLHEQIETYKRELEFTELSLQTLKKNVKYSPIKYFSVGNIVLIIIFILASLEEHRMLLIVAISVLFGIVKFILAIVESSKREKLNEEINIKNSRVSQLKKEISDSESEYSVLSRTPQQSLTTLLQGY